MKTVRLSFRMFEGGRDHYGVELSIDGAAPVAGEFEFDLRPGGRVSSVIAAIERGQATLEDLRDVGSQLWAGLLGGEVGRAYEKLRPLLAEPDLYVQFRLDLPPELQAFPWEALYDEQRGGFLSSRPQICVLRELPAGLERPQVPAAPLDRLRTLVVVPEGSGLGVDHEWQNLRDTLLRLEGSVSLDHLGGRVVPDSLLEALGRDRTDVVHYIGHGWVDEDEHVKIRFNSDTDAHGEVSLDGRSFAAMFEGSAVRLAVLNCCLGAYPSRRLCLSGLGPYLMQRGVPAVVSMRYEIPDIDAIRFSKVFYRHLVDKGSVGRVDVALAKARQALFMNLRDGAARSFITPVLHLATGEEPLFHLQNAAVSTPAIVPQVSEPVNLPADLVEALREGRLIPVLGADLLTADAMRGRLCPLEPRRLVFDLAKKSGYPRDDDLKMGEGSLWLSGHLLPMVCQHFVRNRRRFQLIKLLQEAFEESEAPEPLLALASWRVPGIICTYFDGLVEDALAELGKTPRSLDASAAGEEPGADLVVFHLRGKPSNPDSLVLTEEENERLYDRLANLSSPLLNLLNDGIGRSLLFLGVSPRDPVVRRLGRQLLGPHSSPNRGPAFFVCRSCDRVEEAYWHSLGIEWVEAEPEELVRTLTALVPGRRGTP